jgi:hypothetical protein
MIWLAPAATVIALASAAPAPSAPVAGASSTPPASEAPVITRVLGASVTPGEVTYGGAVTVAGRLTDANQGMSAAEVVLQADAYPFHGFAALARAATAADGGFTFTGVRPDRNTRLRVVLEGSPTTTSAQLSVTVDPSVAINARSLGPGRTRLSIRLGHTVHAGSASASASWFVAARGTRVFRLAAVTQTRELSPGLTYASATIDPPSKRFVYRICLNPAWEHAMGPPATHGRCPRRDYEVRRDVG